MFFRRLSPIETILRSVAPLLGLAFALSCSRGGQTGDGAEFFPGLGEGTTETDDQADDEFGGDPTQEADGAAECTTDAEVVEELESDVGLGFTAQDVLDSAVGNFESSVEWGQPGSVQFGPESGITELNLSVAYEGGEVRVRRPVSAPSSPDELEGTDELEIDEPDTDENDSADAVETDEAIEPNPFCEPALEIDVVLNLSTSGGTFDESFVATLVAKQPDWATFSQQLDPYGLDGAFDVLQLEPENGKLVQFTISGNVSAWGTSGTVRTIVESVLTGEEGEAVAVSAGFGEIATWPASSECPGSDEYGGPGVVVDVAADLDGFSAAEGVELLRSHSPVDWIWDEQTETQLAFELAVEGNACLRQDASGHRVVVYPLALEVETEDERWLNELDALGSSWVGPDGALSFVGLRTSIEPIDAALAAETTGLTDADVTGFDAARLDFFLEYNPQSDSVWGQLDLIGINQPDCPSEPAQPSSEVPGLEVGTFGCRGSDLTLITHGATRSR